jgi:hypothetical protein
VSIKALYGLEEELRESMNYTAVEQDGLYRVTRHASVVAGIQTPLDISVGNRLFDKVDMSAGWTTNETLCLCQLYIYLGLACRHQFRVWTARELSRDRQLERDMSSPSTLWMRGLAVVGDELLTPTQSPSVP